jgi:mRNA interferase MazF
MKGAEKMQKQKKVKYGEIYFYDFGEHQGSIQNGLRPAVVIQDNKLNEHSPTTLIAAITSVTKKIYLPSHIVIGERYGLTKPSMVLMEQVACVNQNELGNYIGTIDSHTMKHAIRYGIKKTFGLWDYSPRGTADVRCLCPKCLQDYIQSNRYIVKRLDPFSSHKDRCDKCESAGYDYVLVPRNRPAEKQMCKSENCTFETEAKNE